MTEPCHMDSHAWKCREQWQSSLQISEESWKWWQNRERISLKLRSNSLRIEKLKKDTENLDILLLLKSQPLHRVAPFSVPSYIAGLFRRHKCRTCGRRESPISQPLSLRDIPFQGNTDHSLWSGRAAPLLQLSAKVSLTRMPRRWSAFATLKIIFPLCLAV